MKINLILAILTVVTAVPVFAAGDEVGQIAEYRSWRLMNPQPIVARPATFVMNEPEFKPDLSAAGG
ncbi:MAG TPA: hypothetical protein PKM58_08210 [Pyrinomonadaceae bacterium]|nr:hypothetical protein [Pyrinomonadaceae bacterium]HNU07758.1 hypothetical protein [Pyrinomonadaceae bacterium]